MPAGGRPKGSPNKIDGDHKPYRTGELSKRNEKLLPLDYMLAVMRDPEIGRSRRDRMAMAAAPYCHKRADERMTKKEILEMAAKTSGKDKDAEWDDALDLPETINPQVKKAA